MKERILRLLDFVIPGVAIIAIICASLYLYSSNTEYKKASSEYEDIEREAVSVEEVQNSTNESADATSEEYVESFINLNIDFDYLNEVNEDVVGWIFIPELSLSYPVLQYTDNSFYLKHTFKKEANFAGAIFLDSEVKSDMSGKNTFIYGHNMKDGSMFGSIKKLKGDTERLKNTEIYYYTSNHAYKYKVFSNFITSAGSFVYYLSEDDEQLSNYLEKIMNVNTFDPGKEMGVAGENRIITLSTCSGSNTGKRTILQGVLVDDYVIR